MARGYPSDILNARRELPNWFADALCRAYDVAAFFPEDGHADQAEAAKRICARCPLEDRCRDYALNTNQRHGVWGGTTEPERRRLRRKLRSVT